MTTVRLRAARPGDTEALSELAMRSKSHWPYPDEVLPRFRSELTLTRDDIARDTVIVAEVDGAIAGFARVADLGNGLAEIADLWVDPSHMGAGVGRTLWLASVESARNGGARTVTIDSDPYSEGFYAAMGAVRVGESPSGSIPGRMLPRLEYELNRQAH